LFFPTAKRYIPLLLDESIMENVQTMVDHSHDGVSKLAQKLVNAVKDFPSTGK